MTRSLSCALRGMFAESSSYHPFGIAVLLLFMATAGFSLLPKHMREQVREFIDSRSRFFNTSYLVFVIVFVTFGFISTFSELGWHF